MPWPNTITAAEHRGFAALLIDAPHARAALSLHGGQLLSFVPQGFDDLLWLSPISRRPPHAIRGGVPVCWPYFGRQGQSDRAPQHGFARNTAWTLLDAHADAEDAMVLTLELPAHAATPLRLTQTLRIGRTLTQTLVTRNDGAEPVLYTQALHTYFRVGDAARVRVAPLHGLRYADKYDAGEHVQNGDWDLHDPRDPGRSDRIYRHSASRFTLLDPVLKRRIELSTAGSRSLVLWNPGAEGVQALGDVPGEGWREFVCVEPANAGENAVELAPDATHVLEQRIGVSALR
jgi:glucose-6-phosphate 1-epimerase